ncbi:MAG: glycosyltransferase [Agarilytica sp.]
MKRHIFILVPADTPDGPIKGAYALANLLAEQRQVTLVTLKRGPGSSSPLDSRVEKVCLADKVQSFRSKISLYKSMLKQAGGRDQVASISMCFSADILNLLCKSYAVICTSVRGNLIANYKMDYGGRGILLGAFHLFSLRRFDHVVAMTSAMSQQVRKYAGVEPTIIGNFVDEAALNSFRESYVVGAEIRFVFVGSLSQRKRPWLIVHALAALRERGVSAVLDLIGVGPMSDYIQSEAQRLGVSEWVNFHGFMASPYPVVAKADAFVLPSLSEGVSRASLEALYLGVPCVLLDVDGNGELVTENQNGALFSEDDELVAAIERAVSISHKSDGLSRMSLLPSIFTQKTAANEYLKLVELQKL